eukprot:6173761-Pleurochrysis_carterae.AAC.2
MHAHAHPRASSCTRAQRRQTYKINARAEEEARPRHIGGKLSADAQTEGPFQTAGQLHSIATLPMRWSACANTKLWQGLNLLQLVSDEAAELDKLALIGESMPSALAFPEHSRDRWKFVEDNTCWRSRTFLIQFSPHHLHDFSNLARGIPVHTRHCEHQQAMDCTIDSLRMRLGGIWRDKPRGRRRARSRHLYGRFGASPESRSGGKRLTTLSASS